MLTRSDCWDRRPRDPYPHLKSRPREKSARQPVPGRAVPESAFSKSSSAPNFPR